MKLDPRHARLREQRELRAGLNLVPGFPEIIARGKQCRLCLLADESPELLRSIHAAYLEGKGVRALETMTTRTWEERKETPLDHRCFDRHFKKHVDFSDVAMAVGQVFDDFAPPPGVESEERALTVVERPKTESPEGVLPPMPAMPVVLARPRPEDEEFGATDYFDMENVIRRLRSRLEQVDQDTCFVDQNGRVNSYGIVIWLKLISEMRQALESLNRMRNSDRLTKALLQAHTKRFAQMLSQPLVARFEVVLSVLKTGTTGDAVLELEKLAKEDVKAIVLRAAEESVRESCEVYKLH